MARLTQVAHAKLAAALHPGDLAIDATAGNGHDTLFLAQQVSPGGHVLAFDRQASALAKTRQRLTDANLLDCTTLIEGDHATMLEHAPTDWQGRVQAIAFNLGYLPGSDKEVITQASSTRAALDASLVLLSPGGLLSVLIYRGHEGGHGEEAMILQWIEDRSTDFKLVDWDDGDFPTDTSPRLLNLIKA